jgi:hypothetical protein
VAPINFSGVGTEALANWPAEMNPDDAKTRNELEKALGLGEAAAIGVLTGALISVGLMTALAPVVATLLVKKFFNPAYGQFCGFWKEKL